MDQKKIEKIEWEVEKGRSPIVVYEKLLGEDSPPAEGFDILVTVTKVATITPEMGQRVSKIASTKDGLVKASHYIYEALGGNVKIHDCIPVVKQIMKDPKVLGGNKPPKLVIRNTVWMQQPDWDRYKNHPGIEASDPERRKEQVPIVESTIEWPETYSGDVSEIDGSEDVNLPKPPARNAGVASITTIAPRRSGGIKRPK
jgi:hypothetical protein